MQEILQLRVNPDWDEVETVRMKSADAIRERGMPGELVDAVSMVACELTENAVKYGFFEGEMKHIEVRLQQDDHSFTVEVRSPMREKDEASLAKLDQMIQWIRGFQDPFEAYVTRLSEVGAQALGNNESGLGLVRIAYEGQSIVDFFVDDHHVITVSAVCPVESGGGA